MIFSLEDIKNIEDFAKRYQSKRSLILEVLFMAQEKNDGWLSDSAIKDVAQLLQIPFIDVKEVVSFYSMFYTEPQKKHIVRVCRTAPCSFFNPSEVCKIFESHIANGCSFSIKNVECLGCCVHAPVVQIDEVMYHDLTPQRAEEICQSYANKTSVK